MPEIDAPLGEVLALLLVKPENRDQFIELLKWAQQGPGWIASTPVTDLINGTAPPAHMLPSIREDRSSERTTKGQKGGSAATASTSRNGTRKTSASTSTKRAAAPAAPKKPGPKPGGTPAPRGRRTNAERAAMAEAQARREVQLANLAKARKAKAKNDRARQKAAA